MYPSAVPEASNTTRKLWLRTLLGKLTAPSPNPTPLLSDNQSTITIASNSLLNVHNKHINLRYHFIHEVLNSKHTTLTYCPMNDMVTDIFMKALVHCKVEKLVGLIGLCQA